MVTVHKLLVKETLFMYFKYILNCVYKITCYLDCYQNEQQSKQIKCTNENRPYRHLDLSPQELFNAE